MKNILVTAKTLADIDGTSGALAYADYLALRDRDNSYEAAFAKGVHIEATYVCEQLGIAPKIITDASDYDQFVLVDASEPRGLPQGCGHRM